MQEKCLKHSTCHLMVKLTISFQPWSWVYSNRARVTCVITSTRPAVEFVMFSHSTACYVTWWPPGWALCSWTLHRGPGTFPSPPEHWKAEESFQQCLPLSPPLSTVQEEAPIKHNVLWCDASRTKKRVKGKKIKLIDICTSSRVLPPADAARGWRRTTAPSRAKVSFWAKLMLALSWRPKISGVSLMGKPRMYAK